MYKYCHFNRDTDEICLLDDSSGKHIFKYEPYMYVATSDETEVKSIYGHNVVKVPKVNNFSSSQHFQKDIDPAKQFLIDCYHDSENPPKYKVLHLDIETDSEHGYSTPGKFDKSIISIALRVDGHSYIILIDKYRSFTKPSTETQTYIVVHTEYDLFNAFIDLFQFLAPDIIVTWNGTDYDIPYIIGRGRKVVGNKKICELSPFGIIDEYTTKKNKLVLKIVGVSHIDYMLLYKKFAESKRDSYSLDNISLIELNRTKLDYEGSLHNFYKSDTNSFIDYNENDCLLLEALESKLKYIQVAVNTCVKGKVNFEDIMYPSMIIDGAIFSYMKPLNLVAPSKKKVVHEADEYEQAEGAYVKLPEAGLYKWVIDLDATSMYPSIIRTLNISPETKLGKILNWRTHHLHKYVDFKKNGTQYSETVEITLYDDSTYELSYPELKDFLTEGHILVSCNGILYSQIKRGLIPKILDEWFAERKKFQELSKKHKAIYVTLEPGTPEYIENKTLAEEYHIKQYRMKILLNTTFGVLLLKSFRYYDEDNGEAITVTGQEILQFGERCINKYLSEKLYKNGETADFVLYGDTDSLFIRLNDFIAEEDSDENNIKKIKELTNEVQKYVNTELIEFTKLYFGCTDEDPKYIDMKQEMIAKTALILDVKKRYALWLVDKEGIPCNEPFYRGIDVRRSDFPLYFKDKLDIILRRILNGAGNEEINLFVKDIIVNMKHQSLWDISIPKGVNNLDLYSSNDEALYVKGAPYHVKATINYNFLLELWKLNVHNEPIFSGEKVRHTILKRNPYDFEKMSFKERSPEKILNFITKYIDYDAIFSSVFENKLDKFYTILKWDRWDNINQHNEYF